MKKEEGAEFLKKDFSLDTYLDKILADSSGECSRLKDKHVRILSKHLGALSEEVLHKKDKIRDGLVTLSLLIDEAKRISKELPDLFFPLSDSMQSREKKNSGKSKELEEEMDKMVGNNSSICIGRVLRHKECITMKIDGEVLSGVMIICDDIVIFGVDAKNSREFYNALLIKELSCVFEGDVLVISLLPVRIEIIKAESSLKQLQLKILNTSKPQKTVANCNGKKNFKSKTQDGNANDLEYKNYLIRIGRIESIDAPAVKDVVREVNALYKMSGWKGASSLLGLLKKMDLLEAVKVYCEIEGSKIEKMIIGVVHAQETSDIIIDKLHSLMCSYINGLEKVFSDPVASGYLSLHLEGIHKKIAELVYNLFYLADPVNNLAKEDVKLTDKLKNAFVYDGYAFDYTVKIGSEIRKNILKKRYVFSKNVMSHIFMKFDNIDKKIQHENE